MTDKEKILEELRKRMLLEMAITRTDFYNDLKNIHEVITIHLILIMLFPNNKEYNHWCSKIYGNFSEFYRLKYKHNKYPTKDDFEKVFINTWYECLDDRLETFIYKTYKKEDIDIELIPLQNIKLDLLRENIKYYINWVISNVNSDTGVVDETSAYNVMHKITVNYNK